MGKRANSKVKYAAGKRAVANKLLEPRHSGPTSLADLLMWPQFVLAQLNLISELMHNLFKLVHGGIAFRTLYSGIDNPAASLEFLLQAMCEAGHDLGRGVTNLHAAG